ncbi:myb-like DNA-binding domain-containing protein, putative [Eimeria praecox]|uniref:Myb-like DNA-binding domain-containing protein, putative n=1 Tax=Eimeria praecox TaxID=51316 RepID=U6G7P3_9EIME|nr:myb-like DNA-binding domain-containing protein, putative [Eimeria praecox]
MLVECDDVQRNGSHGIWRAFRRKETEWDASQECAMPALVFGFITTAAEVTGLRRPLGLQAGWAQGAATGCTRRGALQFSSFFVLEADSALQGALEPYWRQFIAGGTHCPTGGALRADSKSGVRARDFLFLFGCWLPRQRHQADISLMPLESGKTSTPKEARSSSTVTGGPSLLTPSPHDEGAPSVAAAADAAAISPAGAVVSAEGDELLRRMQSVLEEDDSVDILLPSLSSIHVLPASGSAGDFGQLTAATQPLDSSGTLSGLLRCTGFTRGSSRGSGDPAPAADDPDARSRNLGLGLAALHKLQQQQRLAQEQQQQNQQQLQQQRQQSPVDIAANLDADAEPTRQHVDSQDKGLLLRQQQHCIISSSVHIEDPSGEPSLGTREASTVSSEEAKHELAQQPTEQQQQQQQDELRQQQQQLEQADGPRGFDGVQSSEFSNSSAAVNTATALDTAAAAVEAADASVALEPPTAAVNTATALDTAAAAVEAADASAALEPPTGMEVEKERRREAATTALGAATVAPAAEVGTAESFDTEDATTATGAASGSCLQTGAVPHHLGPSTATEQQERWPWRPPACSGVGSNPTVEAEAVTGGPAATVAASPVVVASAKVAAAAPGGGGAAELVPAAHGSLRESSGTANLPAATAACLPPFTPEEEAALMAAGGLHGPEEAAVVAEAEAMAEFVQSLQQQLRQLKQQQQLQQHPQGLEHLNSRPAAVEALSRIEERLRLALEAVDADVAALQREAAATAAATVAFAAGAAEDPGQPLQQQQQQQHQQQSQQRETEASHGDEGELEDEEGFKGVDTLDGGNPAAAGGPAAVWSHPCRALLRAALQSAGRQLPRGKRRGARGAPREWGEAQRHRPPLDVLCLAASQTKAECSLTPEEAAAAAAAAASIAATAAANGSEAAAAAAAAAEALLPPSVAAAASEGVRRVPWLPAEGPMFDSLAAANQSQAFASGMPLLRDICRVATVELRIPPPPPAFAAAAAASPGSLAVGEPIGIAGLRRLGLPGEQQLHRRGPLWVPPPPPEDEEEGPSFRSAAAGGVSAACNEQLVLFLRRDLFPQELLQQIQQQPVCCKAQLLLPPGYEKGLRHHVTPTADHGGVQGPLHPILRLRRLRMRRSAFAADSDGTVTAEATEAAAEASGGGTATAASTQTANAAAAPAGPSLEETGDPESHFGSPLTVDDALKLISKQQRRQQHALEQLLQQLKGLCRGISMQQLVLLASVIDSVNAADAAAAAAAVGDPDVAVFSDENGQANTQVTAAVAAAGTTDSGTENRQQQHQQQQLVRLQKLHEWLSVFPRYGVSAGRAVALLAAAGEQQQQQQQPEGEPVDIQLTFSSLMPYPDEDPGVVVAFALPYKRGPQEQPWTWDLRLLEKGPRSPQGPPVCPSSLQTVQQQIAQRQQRLTFLLRQQKIVCRAMYKTWRCWRRQLERRRLLQGDAFGWGVLPVRALDHPSLLMALPAGFRQGRRRTLRGDAGNDRQRAKEEAASRESKREWMQANFSNLTGPGVFWRESCLFSQGQSLRQRLQKQQQENGGVQPIELIQTDPDWAIFDWERECGYTCNSTRVFEPVEQEAERKAVTVWAEAEARTFVEKYLMYPKNFEKIAACLDGKTTRDCVDFYYRFKFKFGLKRKLQELEDGTRIKKKNRHIGSKQIRREELVHEAVAALSAECGTELMRSFNDRNFLPFDAYSDHLLHREALHSTLKDPTSCRGEDWGEGESDSAEVFVENMNDGYFLPATTKGLVVPGRVVSIPSEAPLWGTPQRCFVPGCLLIDRPGTQPPPPQQQQQQPLLQEGDLETTASAAAPASPPAVVPLPLTLKSSQLDTLLTCMQLASRRFCPQDDEGGPSYMTRSRAARARPVPCGLTGGPPMLQHLGAAVIRSGAGGGPAVFGGPGGPGQLSPAARAVDCLLTRLRNIVRNMHQNTRLGAREKRRGIAEDGEVGSLPLPGSPSTALRIGEDELPLPTPE